MRLKLDTVNQTEFHRSAFDGQYIRTGLILADASDMSLNFPSPDPVVKITAALGMPQIGDPLPVPGYDDWICRRHIIRPQTALNYICLIVYQWLGVLTIRDTSTLEMEMTQIHPKTKLPILASYKRPGANTQPIKKQLQLPYRVPMRHLVMTKTVKYEARQTVIDAFGSVNDRLWQGLKAGFWLFSGVDGLSIDNGKTFTYSVTMSTRQTRDWSEYGWITDDRGNSIVMTTAEQTAMAALIKTDYTYNVDTSVNGFVKAGNQAMTDFGTLLGVS